MLTRERSGRRVAMVGTGMVAPWHADAWRQAGATIIAACDTDEATLRTFSDAYGIAIRDTDYRRLLVDYSHEFDIVDICTPTWLHAPMALDALAAGKHVLCEKPFALSSNEAGAMVDMANRTGMILACRQTSTRLHEDTRTIRKVVQAGTLGDIYFMRLIGRTLYRPGIEYNPGAVWFLDRAKSGGGVLYDWGIYDLDLLFGIFGPLDISEVTAVTFSGVDMPNLETPYDVEEHAIAMLKVRHGPSIYWERAWATHLPSETRWEFYGTQAGLSFLPHNDKLKHPTGMDLRLTRYAHIVPRTLSLPTPAPPGPSIYEDFLQAVAGEQPITGSGRDMVTILRIIEAVYAAANLGRAITL